jgi:hypothetical protein
VWYHGKSPTGPWVVATELPAVIFTIPATHPSHYVTYVYPYTDTCTSTTITYAYLPGYYGVYCYDGWVVYGTGYYYAPYCDYYWDYPVYWYYPPSYGYDTWYNPVTGTYGQRTVAYGPYGGTSAAAAYNPRTGSYARGWSVWDSDERYGEFAAHNPRSGTTAAGNLYYDYDDKEGWSRKYVERGNQWVSSTTQYDGNRASSKYETARGITGTSERVRQGDTITGTGTIQAGDRSGTTAGSINRQGAEVRIDGDGGGSVDVKKTFGETGRDVTVTRPDGTSASRHSSPTDLYAGRNGEVYRRDGNDWSSYSGRSGWQSSPSGIDRGDLDRQYRARTSGSRNYDQFQSQRPTPRRDFGGRSRGGGGR